MKQNFHENLEEARLEPPSDRSTGLVFAAAFFVAALVMHGQRPVVIACAVAAGLFVLVSLWRPRLLHRLNLVWFDFSNVLFRLVNPVTMLIMYGVAIVPFGLVMQLFRDPLRKKPMPEATTYWLALRASSSVDEESMTNQF
jgi:hypothetical protein